MINQYNEAGSIDKFFVWANQTEANILAHPQRCRGFIANDTGALICFDKDNNPLIYRSGKLNFPRLASEPTAMSGSAQGWFDIVAQAFKLTLATEDGGGTLQLVLTDPE